MMKMYQKGFTIAEILITLAIIGIVAVITLPSLTYNSRKQEWVSALAKSYKAISDAFALSQAQNGVLTNWEWKNNDTAYIVETYLLPYLRVGKNCKTEGGCFAKGVYKGLNDANWGVLDDNKMYYKVQLVDGSSWAFSLMSANCVERPTRCMTFHVDVNGKAKPNKLGRDVFTFQVLPITNQVAPNGLYHGKYENGSWIIQDDDMIESFCNLASRGDTCSAKIIREGWQMNY